MSIQEANYTLYKARKNFKDYIAINTAGLMRLVNTSGKQILTSINY